MPHLAVVIRADGTIPFDDDIPLATRQAMVAGLQAQGKTVEWDPATNRLFIPDWVPPPPQAPE